MKNQKKNLTEINENQVIQQRQDANKNLLIDQLKKTPIVQIACEKLSIWRSTYYRWRQEDRDFKRDSSKAIEGGKLLINDMAESQLISAIKDKNLTAIIFWLKNNHKDYEHHIRVTANTEDDDGKLTEEQESTIRQALKLASLTSVIETKEDNW